MFPKPKSMHKSDFDAIFAEKQDVFPGLEHSWQAALRQDSFNKFTQMGIPTPANEQWVFTNLKPLVDAKMDASMEVDVVPSNLREQLLYLFELPEGPRLLFIDGQYYEPLSTKFDDLPRGVTAIPMSQALEENHPILEEYMGKVCPDDQATFAHLNAALMTDGFLFHIEKESHIYQPIVIAHISSAQETTQEIAVRNLVVAEEGAKGLFIEVYMGLDGSKAFTNVASEFVLDKKAHLEHLKVHKDQADAFHVSSTFIQQAEQTHFESFTLSYGGRLTRLEAHATLHGNNTECQVNGALLLKEKRQGDSTTRITHKGQGCLSKQMCKVILLDKAKGVFQGKTIVERNAQKTDGYQLNQNLLLSPKAQIDTKPELEIYADDVKCSHGATTGDLDDHALFYLRSRGIEEKQAKQMLVEAFIDEAIQEMSYEPMQEHLHKAVSIWLKGLNKDDN